MDPAITSAIISGIGSIASGVLNSNLGAAQSEDLMYLQNRLNRNNFDYMNLYNRPIAQMRRLSQAGLNPNLVYGSGVDGNQSSAPNVGIANRHGQLGNPIQDAVVAYNQSRLASASVDKTEQDIKESKAREKLTDAKVISQLTANKWQDPQLEANLNQTKQQILESISRERENYAQIRVTDNQLAVMDANIKLMQARTGLTERQAATELVRQEVLQSQINLNEATIRRIGAEIPYIKAGTDLREQAAKIQGVEFDAGKAGDQWLAEHPKVAVVYNLLCKLLGVGKDVAKIVPGM